MEMSMAYTITRSWLEEASCSYRGIKSKDQGVEIETSPTHTLDPIPSHTGASTFRPCIGKALHWLVFLSVHLLHLPP